MNFYHITTPDLFYHTHTLPTHTYPPPYLGYIYLYTLRYWGTVQKSVDRVSRVLYLNLYVLVINYTLCTG